MTAGQDEAAIDLLADLGQAEHWAAVPSDLVEERMDAAAHGLGVQAQAAVLPGFLAIEIEQGASRQVDLRRVATDTHFDLRRLHALAELSDALARGDLGVAGGRAELDRITHQRPRFGKPLVLVGYGVYGAAVAVRVGGGIREALAGVAVGLVGGAIHFTADRSRAVDLQQSFLAALVGTLVALVLSLFFPFNAAQAVFGGMCLLVPAMVVTIGVHELASDALESGTARIAYGALRFLMLGFGIAAAAKLWSLGAPIPPRVTVSPLPWPVVLAMVGVGGAALMLCLQGRPRDLPWIIGAAVIAYGTKILAGHLLGGHGADFVAALALGIASGLQARLPGHTPATMLIPGLLQVAPGFVGTQAMLNFAGPAPARGGSAHFADVFTVALQLVMGLLVADLLVGRLGRIGQRAPAESRRGALRPSTV